MFWLGDAKVRILVFLALPGFLNALLTHIKNPAPDWSIKPVIMIAILFFTPLIPFIPFALHRAFGFPSESQMLWLINPIMMLILVFLAPLIHTMGLTPAWSNNPAILIAFIIFAPFIYLALDIAFLSPLLESQSEPTSPSQASTESQQNSAISDSQKAEDVPLEDLVTPVRENKPAYRDSATSPFTFDYIRQRYQFARGTGQRSDEQQPIQPSIPDLKNTQRRLPQNARSGVSTAEHDDEEPSGSPEDRKGIQTQGVLHSRPKLTPKSVLPLLNTWEKLEMQGVQSPGPKHDVEEPSGSPEAPVMDSDNSTASRAVPDIEEPSGTPKDSEKDSGIGSVKSEQSMPPGSNERFSRTPSPHHRERIDALREFITGGSEFSEDDGRVFRMDVWFSLPRFVPGPGDNSDTNSGANSEANSEK